MLGFVNLEKTNNHLLAFEASLKSNSGPKPLTKTMLVLMVCGLLSDLQFPYAQFSGSKLTGNINTNYNFNCIIAASYR